MFFVYFDLSIVGMYFIIAGWGHGDRARAAATPRPGRSRSPGRSRRWSATGLLTGALFLLPGVLYDRGRTDDMDVYSGLAGPAPVFAAVTAVAAFGSLGLPGLSGFIAEFQIFTGSLATAAVATAIAVTGILITAALFLRALKCIFTGPLRLPGGPRTPAARRDLTAGACLAGLATAGLAAADFGTSYAIDTATGNVRIIVLAATLLIIGPSASRVASHPRETEFYVLLQLAALGTIVLAGAADLLLLFAGYLLTSVPGYALAGFAKDGPGTEAAMKYYLIGALHGVFMLAGITVLDGIGRTTSYPVLRVAPLATGLRPPPTPSGPSHTRSASPSAPSCRCSPEPAAMTAARLRAAAVARRSPGVIRLETWPTPNPSAGSPDTSSPTAAMSAAPSVTWCRAVRRRPKRAGRTCRQTGAAARCA